MSLETFDGMVEAMVAAGVARDGAMRFAEAKFGRSSTGPAIDVASEDDLREEAEDAHVVAAVKLMRALGFEWVHFSSKKRVKVTPGIPDEKFYHRARRLTLWWEAKAERGRVSPAQAAFHEMARDCGEIVVVGKLEVLKCWLVDAGVATRNGELFEPTPAPPLPAAPVRPSAA